MLQRIQYNLLKEAIADWFEPTEKKLRQCSMLTYNKNLLNTSVTHVRDIENSLNAGHEKVTEFTKLADDVFQNTGARGQQNIENDRIGIKSRWSKLLATVAAVKENLKSSQERLETFEQESEKFVEWMKKIESKTRIFTLLSTLEEKKLRVETLEVNILLPHYNTVVIFRKFGYNTVEV